MSSLSLASVNLRSLLTSAMSSLSSVRTEAMLVVRSVLTSAMLVVRSVLTSVMLVVRSVLTSVMLVVRSVLTFVISPLSLFSDAVISPFRSSRAALRSDLDCLCIQPATIVRDVKVTTASCQPSCHSLDEAAWASSAIMVRSLGGLGGSAVAA